MSRSNTPTETESTEASSKLRIKELELQLHQMQTKLIRTEAIAKHLQNENARLLVTINDQWKLLHERGKAEQPTILQPTPVRPSSRISEGGWSTLWPTDSSSNQGGLKRSPSMQVLPYYQLPETEQSDDTETTHKSKKKSEFLPEYTAETRAPRPGCTDNS